MSCFQFLGNGPFKRLPDSPGSSGTLCGIEDGEPHQRRTVARQVVVTPVCAECGDIQRSTPSDSVCGVCGAYVADREKHVRFHDDLRISSVRRTGW